MVESSGYNLVKYSVKDDENIDLSANFSIPSVVRALTKML